AYAAHLDDVRGTLYQLFTDGEYPIASRLFFAVYLADRTRPFFHAKTPEVDEGALGRELAALEDPRLREALHEQLRKSEAPTAAAAVVILKVLAARMRGRTARAFRRLLGEVLGAYAAAGAGSVAAEGERHDVTLSPERLFAMYR